MILLCLALIGYMFYDKHMETKQVEAITNYDGLSFEELSELIDKIKR